MKRKYKFKPSRNTYINYERDSFSDDTNIQRVADRWFELMAMNYHEGLTVKEWQEYKRLSLLNDYKPYK